MKMLENRVTGFKREDPVVSGGRTVLVGVKFDPQSRELLTWAMVKVAQPGDTVIALHILGDHEIVDRFGKSSLLSLVKAFDSVLAVYEGFCNLKQVDLKLKLCRGSSVRKILVREAESYHAAKVIVGTARTHHTIRSSSSVAKYCAKKLPRECWVIAVHNGKVVYQKEGKEDHHHNSLLNLFHRSRSSAKNTKVLSIENTGINLEQALVKVSQQSIEGRTKPNCSICGCDVVLADASCVDRGACKKSMVIIPAETDAIVKKHLPEVRPGWPLLRSAIVKGAILKDPQGSFRSSLRQISVVQWALRLPSRNTLLLGDSDRRQTSGLLDGKNGAIVLVGTENETSTSSPDYYNWRSLPKELEGLHDKYSATCRLFTYEDLVSATSNFLPENLIGKGGNSQVYRGCLPDSKELAVKILKRSEDVLKEFVLEIEIITTLHHKNIISLIGFCFEDNHLLLVYDLLSRGSLEENLHGNKKEAFAFGWCERYKVAVGVAEALTYLHDGTSQPVIHRDVKSSNILLSDDFEPQLSDFGLAKWAPTTSSHITCTDVVGTFGYLAPEYFMYGKVNEKIDVYAFGVVLLELLTGRKPICSEYPKGQVSLVMWAKPILNEGRASLLLDPKLGENYDLDELERMVLAATLCIRHSPRARPRMRTILALLQGDRETSNWARQQVNDLSEENNVLDNEGNPRPNLQSHLSLALLDVEDDSLSMSSIDQQRLSWEEYLQGRWSRSSSFD